MKNLLLAIVVSLCALGVEANKSSNEIDSQNSCFVKDKIEVYYFHFSRRCATCNAVEQETKNALNEFFSEKVEGGEIVFISVNLDEEKGKEIGKQFETAMQKLLIVSGEKQVDLTNMAFLNARSNPNKFKNKIKNTINSLSE